MAVVGDVLTAIDQFLVAVHTVPAAGKRSAFAAAALREELREFDGKRKIARVLFVSASSASAAQFADDRPLLFEDKFESIASLSISYWMIDTATSDIVAAGTAAGSARLKGSIGGSVEVQPVKSL